MRSIERQAARLVVLSPQERVLLLRLEPTFRDPFWVTPGGGLDDGETFEHAAIRELYEEVGRDDLTLGPCLWRRRVEFTWEDWRVTQHERSFLVSVPEEFDPVFVHLDLEPITGFGLFGPGDLETAAEVVYPSELAGLITTLFKDGVPATPIELEDSVEV